MRRVVVVVLIVAVLIAMTLWPDNSGLAPTPPDLDSGSEASGDESVEVIEIIDGDSVVFLIDGVEVETRLRGVNAFEARACGGPEATGLLRDSLRGRIDVVGDEVDRYGRLLVDVRVDGVDVNGYLVDQGAALGYHADGRYVARTQEAAAERETGWWGMDCDPAFDGELRLGDVEVDPPGDDRSRLNDEYVTVVNPSSAPAALAGWILRDETTGHVFELPEIDVPAGGEVIVHTGDGAATTTDVYLGERRPVWSNDGETVLLLDPSGTLVDVRFFD